MPFLSPCIGWRRQKCTQRGTDDVMMDQMMGGGMMWGMGIVGILVIAVLVLVIGALLKYLFRR